jgi:hypothetical protein
MKPQDVMVLLKIAISDQSDSETYASLSQRLKMSASEIHAAVNRVAAAGLLTIQSPRRREVHREKLLQWLKESVATTFPAKHGPVALGMPTGLAAVRLPEIQTQVDDLPFVWPTPEGVTRGKSIKPLYKSAPQAAKMDHALHECLALVDLLRIGTTREKESAIQELRRRIMPKGSVALTRIGSPFDINERDIEEWSGNSGAPFMLPELVRRIILCLEPNSHPDFPAQKATYFHGFDGMIETAGSSRFADTPCSYWEINDRQNAKKKVQADFRKRCESTDPAVRRESTFVLLTSRLLPDRRELEVEFKQKGEWFDVRIYDATHLAQWLSLAIPAAVWFREIMGQDTLGLETAQGLLDKWEADSRLPHSVVCVGRETEKEKILSWLRNEKPGALRIRAETLQECALFAASVVFSTEEVQQWLARLIIVRKEDAWQRLLARLSPNTVSPLFLIPIFPEFDGSVYKTEGCYVLIPSEPGKQDRGANIYLLPFPRDDLAKFLSETRYLGNKAKAEDLTAKSGCKLTSLVRLVDGIFFRKPAWLELVQSAERISIFCGLLLAGAWDPRNENDKRVLRALCNATDDAIENETNRLLSQVSDPPLREQAYSLKWRSHADAWRLLAPSITASQLTRFQKACVEVLAYSSAKYDLPPGKRMYASIRGIVDPYSQSLRDGLADSLAWLRVNRDECSRSDVQEKAIAVIRASVQSILDGDWKRWATLGNMLSTLAEADADTFLSSLESALNDPEKNLAPLFQQHAEGGFFSDFSSSGLLWALQTIAWYDMDYFSRLVDLLVSLDKPSNISNRPFSVLMEFFHPQAKRCVVPNQIRLEKLKRLCESQEEIAWRLLVAIAGRLSHGGFIIQNILPRFVALEKLPQDFEEYSPREVADFFSTAFELIKKLLSRKPDRLRDLLESRAVLPLVLDCLSSHLDYFRNKPLQESRDIQSKLRTQLLFTSKRDGMDKLRNRIQEAIASLDPDDPVVKNAWIFSFQARHDFDDLKSDLEKLEEEWVQRRKDVISTIPDDDLSLQTITKLARSAPEPTLVGETVVQSSLADKIEQAVWSGPLLAQGAEASFASSFVHTRFVQKGWPWFKQCLARLLKSAKRDVILRLIQSVPSIPEIRDWIEKEVPDMADEYWRTRRFVHHQDLRDVADFRRCIQNLIRSSNWKVALDLAGRATRHNRFVDAESVIQLLEYVLTLPNEKIPRDSAWLLDGIFEWLDQHAEASHVSRIFTLALNFFGLLDDQGRKPVFQKLSNEPAFFVELLELFYRPESRAQENDTGSAREGEKRKNVAMLALDILEKWKRYPGDNSASPTERDTTLTGWCAEVLELAKEKDHKTIGERKVGEVLARVPAHDDGIWPCLVARQFLRKGYEKIRNGLHTARCNSRGVVTRSIGEGGKQERALAASYRADAERLRPEWPETAALLDGLAKWYEELAKREDKEAEQFE